MIKMLQLICLFFYLFHYVKLSIADCNAAKATKRSECSKYDIDDNNKCCLFTSGAEQSNSCHVVDLTSVYTMNSAVTTYKKTLPDQENFGFDCGSKIEKCVQVKSPYDKRSCHIIEIPNSETCCLLEIDNFQSCFPVSASTVESIESFANKYKEDNNLPKKPNVLCEGKRFQIAIISLLIIALTLL